MGRLILISTLNPKLLLNILSINLGRLLVYKLTIFKLISKYFFLFKFHNYLYWLFAILYCNWHLKKVRLKALGNHYTSRLTCGLQNLSPNIQPSSSFTNYQYWSLAVSNIEKGLDRDHQVLTAFLAKMSRVSHLSCQSLNQY